MTWPPDKSNEGAIVRFDGTPIEPHKPGERGRWQRFMHAIWPWAKRGGKWAACGTELAREYGQAEVLGRKHKATQLAAEAAETAARADQARQKAVLDFGTVVDDIFRDDGQPEAARMLKLAKLMEQNPALNDQVEKIGELIQKLSYTRGTSVEIKRTLPKSLESPVGETSDTAQADPL